MKIAFIGLGVMGKPMVKNLLKAGYEVHVFDHHQSNIDEVTASGAIAGKSNAELFKIADVIITMLPNGPQVKSIVAGNDGLLNNAREKTVFIDMSSIAPTDSKEIAKMCETKGISMLDAPVSGGEPKAVDGTLSIMVGGDKKTFETYKPLLLKMGKSVVYCGTVGAGNTTKLANQMIVAGNIAILAEALTLAKKAGVDPQTVFEAIKGGLAGSTVMNAKAPMMLHANYEPGFRIDLHIKDLNNAIETGHKMGAPLPLTVAIQEMFETLHADGNGTCDHSGLALYYEKLSGIKI